MAWRQVTIALRGADVERAESLLTLAGAEALTLADDGDDPVLEPPPGAVELWPRVRMTALFDASIPAAAIETVITAALDVAIIETVDVSEQDWIGGWQQQVEPIAVGGGLCIVPAAMADAVDPATAVLLNMGLAFGTGRHPTTRLCLEWLGNESATGASVLDYGCGSGVLALAALKRGAEFAYATDNDEQALIATVENAMLNGMREQLWVGPPETLPDVQVDLLLANILAGTLQDHADALTQRQAAGGRIVLSGILAAQADGVIATFASGYRDFITMALDGWVRISATRR